MHYFGNIAIAWMTTTFFLGFHMQLSAQPTVELPTELNLVINDKPYTPTEGWMDSLLDQSKKLQVKYEIVNSVQNGSQITTKVRMPQVLTFSSVLHQIILYYALLSDESARSRENLLIYPYFDPLSNAPAIYCSYSPSTGYEIIKTVWETIHVPTAPGPEETYFYNQIIEKTLENLDIIDDIPDEIFMQVASENKRSVQEIKIIYQNILLWQMANPK